MDISLKDIMALPPEHELRKALFNLGVGNDYDVFCENVENTILECILRLEAMKPQFAKLGEDTLTGILSLALQMKGFAADHDNYRNGHCDLVILSGLYEWYGEAKLDDGPNYILEGFRQLCDRYTPASPTRSRGGLIIYTAKENKVKVLEKWIERIVQEFGIPIDFTSICPNTITARSAHIHPASGIKFRVRHFPISFFHEPTDDSARKRKKK